MASNNLQPRSAHVLAHVSALLCSQDTIFYLSLYIVALGTGGIKPNVSAFGADQFDEANPKVCLLVHTEVSSVRMQQVFVILL